MQRTSVQDIKVGESVRSVFLVAQATKQESRNGPFWRVELRDATGSLEAKIWSPLSQQVNTLDAGAFVEIKGKTSLFRDKIQLTIEAISFIEDSELIDISDFLPTSKVPPTQILGQIESLIKEELRYKPWKNFAQSVLKDPEIRNKLLTAPAAKNVHHAYAGGLLEHSLSVAKVCLLLCENYPELDRQLLFVAGLFHDIGKLQELSSGLVTDYTDEGRLVGHIVQGLFMLRPFLIKAKVEPELVLHFEHLILSHHGLLEYGSPKVPATAEAFILHYADNIDAKVQQIKETFPSIKQEESSEYSEGSELSNDEIPQAKHLEWSNWNSLLGRHLCRVPTSPENIPKTSESRKPKEKQHSFFNSNEASSETVCMDSDLEVEEY